MSVVTLQDAKTHLGIDTDVADMNLQNFLNRVEAALSVRIGSLAPTQKSERVRGWRNVLQLRYTPVVSLTSVTSIEGLQLDVNLLTPMPGGRVEWKQFGYFASHLYDVVYQSGFATLPEDLKLGVLELVRLFWETGNQRGPLRNTPGSTAMQRIPAIPYAGFDEPVFNQLIDQLAKPYRPVLGA